MILKTTKMSNNLKMDKMDLTEVKTPYEGKINTYSGIRIDLRNPTPAMIKPTDIAHALGYICRFGGQLNNFYSVAQHSILVMMLAPLHLKRAALIHDAAEAYLGDVISPLKHILKDVYEPLETAMQIAIFERFNEPIEHLALIKKYDMQAYEMEREAYKKGRKSEWVAFWTNNGYDLMNWNPEYASTRMWVELEHWFAKEVHNA